MFTRLLFSLVRGRQGRSAAYPGTSSQPMLKAEGVNPAMHDKGHLRRFILAIITE
jgi:hypothetical protein